jgi:hypothetical protein
MRFPVAPTAIAALVAVGPRSRRRATLAGKDHRWQDVRLLRGVSRKRVRAGRCRTRDASIEGGRPLYAHATGSLAPTGRPNGSRYRHATKVAIEPDAASVAVDLCRREPVPDRSGPLRRCLSKTKSETRGN